jgi:hypothetical protein
MEAGIGFIFESAILSRAVCRPGAAYPGWPELANSIVTDETKGAFQAVGGWTA